jgi:hypothetical protein
MYSIVQYATVDKLQQHTHNSHPTSRNHTNLDIVLHTFPAANQQPPLRTQLQDNWQHTLTWLTQLHVQPPTTRKTLYHKLKPQHKTLVFSVLSQIITWANQATLPFDSEQRITLPTSQTTATPFLKLILIFESIFLAPPTEMNLSYSKLLQQRHTLLKQGSIQELYERTRTTIPHTKPTPTIPTFDDLQYNRTAQMAADNDNLHTAYNRIRSITPQVSLSPQYLTILKKLYPTQIQYDQQPARQTRHTNKPKPPPPPPITPQQILQTLQKQKRGTAPGPFADSIDLFRDFATYTTHRSQTSHPYLSTFTTLINTIATNNIPTDIQTTFAAQYVIALHKDPQNLSKIRPIGIGTALRRLTAATLMTIYGRTIADQLVPHGQFGIAIPGGLDFIVHSTQAQIQTYVTTHQRALVTLDIANMFNAISRQACRHTIALEQSLHPLLPYFDLLYSNANTCWFQKPDHTYDNFPQPEGFTQGCPLSGAFADLVLTLVLQPINNALTQRIKHRDPSAIPPSTMSYHDDTSIVLPYQDIEWFLTTFQQLGNPLGIQLNLSKTQILTTLSPETPALTPADQLHLHNLLQKLHPNVEQREGLRLLGQPVGSSTYATTFLHSYITRLQHTLSQQLTHRIHDHQTQLAILKHCAIPSILHLLTTHAYHHWHSKMETSLYHWNSDATLAIRILIHNLIAHITQQQTLPTHAIPIIHLPATLGGIGIRDPIASTIPAAITTITRSLRYAIYGLPNAHGSTTQTAPIHTHTMTHNTYTELLHHYAPTFLPIIQSTLKTTTLTLETFIQNTPLPGIQKLLYHHHQHMIRKTFHQFAPPTVHLVLDSLLSPLTSIPIASMSRRVPSNRIPNDEFRILLQRKLRLPIFSPSFCPKQCTCRNKPNLDPYGDHLFSCTSASKTPLHNQLRDTLYHILHRLGPYTNLVRTSTDIILEPPNLLPTHPTLRPADIGIQLLPTPNYYGHQHPEPYLAIDITFTHTPTLCLNTTDRLIPSAQKQNYQVHDDSTKQKFNVAHAHHIQHQGIALLPFTIDHLGGLGYHATQFLFGQHPTILPINTEPSWTLQNFRNNPAAIELYNYSKSLLPKGILPTATKKWNQQYFRPTRYGQTYHTFTPESWATQALAINLTKALTHHLLTHTHRIHTYNEHQRKIHKQNHHIETPPYYLPPPPFLLPSESPAHDTLLPAASHDAPHFSPS